MTTIAFVGTRRPTRCGYELAYRAAFELGRLGFTIVTGGQTGVDYAAALGAANAGARLILVLPWRGFNEALLRPVLSGAEVYVVDGGSSPGEKLVMRTRRVVEISDVVVVPEARASGRGTFVATGHASRLGKPVYAFTPCTTDDDVWGGYRKLVGMGAKSVDSVDELLVLLLG